MNISKEAILKVIEENPGLRKREIGNSLHVHHFEILKFLYELEAEGKIRAVYFHDPANMEFYDRYYLNI